MHELPFCSSAGFRFFHGLFPQAGPTSVSWHTTQHTPPSSSGKRKERGIGTPGRHTQQRYSSLSTDPSVYDGLLARGRGSPKEEHRRTGVRKCETCSRGLSYQPPALVLSSAHCYSCLSRRTRSVSWSVRLSARVPLSLLLLPLSQQERDKTGRVTKHQYFFDIF